MSWQVVGIDFCGRFIDAAMKIQGGKVVQYGSQQVARLPSQALPSRVQLKQVHVRIYIIIHVYEFLTLLESGSDPTCCVGCVQKRYIESLQST